MASDMFAKPDFSKKVRYNRKQKEDTSDWKECEVEIYNDAYESVEDTTGVQSPEQDMVANISNLQMEVKELKKHSEDSSPSPLRLAPDSSQLRPLASSPHPPS
ncbi:uncharacterized protein LOC110015840 isoform X12 [Oryzias latipes]|uniref:uncharacterized protein LOC110015840 isoform X12 n=1 Tax=Oryzias latipes TaxID=8090 RepID=UPI000CE22F59|nr:uncharacterized protein LOC110015840 isoform X12 [Oryzias latipes]